VPRYKLILAYDGTDFCGWQKQEPFAPGADDRPADQRPPNPAPGPAKLAAAQTLGVRDGETRARLALRTVQHVVEQAVIEVVREPVVLTGASRTDSGVHAKGQVAAFTCGGEGTTEQAHSEQGGSQAGTEEERGACGRLEGAAGGAPPTALRSLPTGRGGGWPASRGVDRLVRALNGRLPDDVQIVSAEIASSGFDPIRGAVAKAYSYTFHVASPLRGGLRPMWDRRYVHHVWDDLDVARMHDAAQVFVGEHDFAGFAAAGHGRQTTVRTVYTCAVTELPPVTEGRRVRLDISGNGFLWNMVRIIGGTLLEVGRGRMTAEQVHAALASGDRRGAGPTLPPTGLCLEWIRY